MSALPSSPTAPLRTDSAGAQRRDTLADRLEASRRGVAALAEELDHIDRWGRRLRRRLGQGARLLVAGNGGSAALGHHLVAELVGRFEQDRAAYSALVLSAEPAAVTGIANDYGYDHVFARQVEAHGRSGDVFLALSTSGRSGNLLTATDTARRLGLETWAMTGPAPNPLAIAVDDVVAVPCDTTSTVQDVHQVAVHLLCLAFDLVEP
jgi:D-sedoheptulose 7-phosphate isomerase